MQTFNLVYAACATALALASLFRLRELLATPRDPHYEVRRATLRAVCATLGFATGAFVFAAPSSYIWVDEMVGIPNLATPIVYSFVVLFGKASMRSGPVRGFDVIRKAG